MLCQKTADIYSSVSQPLWDRGPVNSFFIRRGPGPNRFTCQYLSIFFLSSYIKLTQVLIINYGIIIKTVSTITCTVWHVDKYKITFKLVINSRRYKKTKWNTSVQQGIYILSRRHQIRLHVSAIVAIIRSTQENTKDHTGYKRTYGIPYRLQHVV